MHLYQQATCLLYTVNVARILRFSVSQICSSVRIMALQQLLYLWPRAVARRLWVLLANTVLAVSCHGRFQLPW